MAKWLVGMVVNNGEATVIPAIESIYDFADKIFIVEGGIRQFPGEIITDNGLSTDGTTEKIERFINEKDLAKKIIHAKVGITNGLHEKRQIYLDYAQKHLDEFDWILVLDDDEGYLPHQLKFLNMFIEGNKDLVLILNDVYWFFEKNKICVKNLFEQEYPDLVGLQPYQSEDMLFFEDGYFGTQIYSGQLEERIFRNLPGLNHSKSHANVCDPNGEFLYSQGAYFKKRAFILDACLNRYHYYTINKIRRRNTIKYCGILEENINISDNKSLEIYAEKHPYYAWLNQGKPMHKLITGLKPGMRVEFFNGQHVPAFEKILN